MPASAVDSTYLRLVELACHAPSIGNSQPWRWTVEADRIDLWADRARALPTDPEGRQLLLSCGAALHHAQVAAAALGRPAATVRLPNPDQPDLLASLHPRRGPITPGALTHLNALKERRTDRRRFTTWPIPGDRLARLIRSVDRPGIHVLSLSDKGPRATVARLVHAATGSPDSLVAADGVLALCTDDDDTLSRLRAGEGLSVLWLRATTEGMSIVPMSEVVEMPDARAALSTEVLGGLVHPQLLLRVGWQLIGDWEELRSARRPMSQVLDSP
jgi:hypothetical protein